MEVLRFFQRISVWEASINSMSNYTYRVYPDLFVGCFLLFLLFLGFSFLCDAYKRGFRICAWLCLTITLCQFCYSFFEISNYGLDWGYHKDLYTQAYDGPERVGRVLSSMMYSSLQLPEDYIYDGYFSREFILQLGHDYSNEEEQDVMDLYFSDRGGLYNGEKFYADPLKPGEYYWYAYQRDHKVGYTGSPFRMYINVPEEIIAIWGVGMNLKYDLTRAEIDNLHAENKLKSLKYQSTYSSSGRLHYDRESDMPSFLIKYQAPDGERYWGKLW